MQKIIPFKKESKFKDNVAEITSISLEHSLHKEKDNLITGEFLVSGEYKVVETSSVTDKFSFNLPFDIHLDEKYDVENATVDIDDFYYEIINNNTLKVNIDVLINKIEEVELVTLRTEEMKPHEIETTDMEKDLDEVKVDEIVEERNENNITEEIILSGEIAKDRDEDRKEVEVEIVKERKETVEKKEMIEEIKIESKEEISDLFDDINGEIKIDSTYRVYIVKEEDTLDTIISKYGVNKEVLSEYNILEEIKKGDKIIIPCSYSEKV